MRNLIIDLRQVPSRNKAIGLHWQVAQATSLVNVVVEMSTASGTNHQGKKIMASRDTNLSFCDRNIHGERQVGLHHNLGMFCPVYTRVDCSSGGFMGGK